MGGWGWGAVFRRLKVESPSHVGTDRHGKRYEGRLTAGRDEAVIKVAIFCRLASIIRSVYRAYSPAEGHLAGTG